MIKALFFILVAAFTAYLFYAQSQTKEIILLIKSIDIDYIYGALFCMLAYLFINASVIYIIAHNISGKIKIFSAFYLSCAGQYYGMLTPMGSGTQPAQVMILKNKYDIDYSKGTSITVKQYIIYQIAVSIISFIMFMFKYDFLVANYATYMPFIYLGLFTHVLLSLALVLLSYTDYLKNIMIFVFKKLKKLNLFKKTDEASFSLKLDEYTEYMMEMKDNKKAMFLIISLSIIQITAYFSVTYFVYRAFRLDSFSFFDLLAIQSIVYIVVSFIPTPGNAVASESGFYVLLQPFFPPGVLIYAVLVWRFITYYLNIIFNGSVLILIKIIEFARRKLQDNASYKI